MGVLESKSTGTPCLNTMAFVKGESCYFGIQGAASFPQNMVPEVARAAKETLWRCEHHVILSFGYLLPLLLSGTIACYGNGSYFVFIEMEFLSVSISKQTHSVAPGHASKLPKETQPL